MPLLGCPGEDTTLKPGQVTCPVRALGGPSANLELGQVLPKALASCLCHQSALLGVVSHHSPSPKGPRLM